MNRSGFTLIELLAVIIILAIIALIATPIILNVIDDTKKSAGLSEANLIYSGINNYCATSKVKNQLDGSEDICADGIAPEEVSSMVNLGNAEVLEVIYTNKLLWLKVESNGNIYSLVNEKMELGDIESPKLLSELLLKQYSEGATTGLVKDTSNPNLYYYVGSNEEVGNNYLWYGGHHWRVMEIDTTNNTLLLISQQPLTSIAPANAVWDTKDEYNSSYINNWLNDYFYNSLNSSIQNNIVNNTFNVGIYTDVEEIITNQKVGLLDEDQYTRAGGEDSYLDIKDYWWLGNRYNSSDVRGVTSYGSMNNDSPTNVGNVRAVIKIFDVTITGGDGTLESNYKVGTKATNTNDIQLGEYINVPYSGSDGACGTDNKCTFRVVSKDNDSIKVILNGLLPSTSQYGSNTTITTSHMIYTSLNSFANNISNQYLYIGNKSFYIGDYQDGTNYTSIQDETLSANVGLPTVGEIFSGNDIDLGTSSTKIFVDDNTIENSTSSSNFWLINRYNSSYVRLLFSNGGMGYGSPTVMNGVRPVIYLKSGSSALTFTEGEGTAQSPYEL